MGLKLLVILLIIGIQASNGGKILKKLSKELKKVIGGAKFEDFIKDNIAELAGISDDVAENADKIHLVADNITEKIHIVADHVANNSDHIHLNSDKIHLIADHLDNATRCTAINWDYTCCTSANPCSLGQGDCDSDDECSGDLKCGLDNCIGYGVSDADCCILVGIHDNALNIANIKVDVVNNDAAISSNTAAISSIDSSIVSISEDVANNILDVTNLKVDVANNLANITKNAMDIASHHSSDCDPNEHVNAILEYGKSETVPDWTVTCSNRGEPGTGPSVHSSFSKCTNWWCYYSPGYISTQLIGNGRGRLNYGLCGGVGSSDTNAKVTVTLNGNEISSTFGGSVIEPYKDVEFDYSDSDILKIEEKGGIVLQFNSFSVIGCN